MILLDTTVLAHALGEGHPLRAPSRSLLAAHGDGRILATTTVEVLQEFLHLRARRRPREEAAERMLEYASAFDPLITSAQDLRRGAEIFVHHPHIGAVDAVLAAVALNAAADTMVSADRAFADVPGLRLLDLADPALLARVGATGGGRQP